jgi:hypothetical protein
MTCPALNVGSTISPSATRFRTLFQYQPPLWGQTISTPWLRLDPPKVFAFLCSADVYGHLLTFFEPLDAL